jgi:outer membrane protein assembly factor BamB
MRVLIALLLLLAPEGSPPLGSPDFRPTREQPFGWRGDGSGRFPGATPATEWSLTKNVRWSTVVGRSYSSPIVIGKLVVVSSEPDLLIGLDRSDGRELWKMRVTPADLTDSQARSTAEAYKLRDSGGAAATPVSDGTTIYAVFANGIVRAVDLGGKAKWTAFIDAPQSTQYGRSSSPILTAGKLIVHMTNLYAFDPAGGKQLWMNSESRSAYGTPAPLRSGNADLIVTPAGDVVRADDGKGVNTQIGVSSNSSPVVSEGIVYFGETDIRAIRLGAEFKDESVWNCGIEGEATGSPLLHDGFMFTATGKGGLFVFDTRLKGSTEPVIKARALFGDEAGATPLTYSSFTLAGKYLFLASNLGDIVVLEATREAKPVARNKLKDGTGSSPVFSGKDMFLRDGDRLFCIAE